jgi:hypothetical protein
VIQGAGRKGEPFRELLAQLGLDARQVCYVGDDLADLPVLLAVGLAACPADAAAEVRAGCTWSPGPPAAAGAVREGRRGDLEAARDLGRPGRRLPPTRLRPGGAEPGPTTARARRSEGMGGYVLPGTQYVVLGT